MQQLKSEREAKIQTQKRIRKLQFGEYTEKSADSPKLAFLLDNKSRLKKILFFYISFIAELQKNVPPR